MLYHSNIQQPHLSVQVEKWQRSSMSNLILCWFLSRCCQPSVHIGRASSMPCSKIFGHSARHLSPNSLAALRSFGSWHRRSGKKLLPSNARKDASIQQDEVGHLLRSLQNVGHLNMVEIHFKKGSSWNLIIEASVLLSHPPIAQCVHSGYTTWKSLRSKRKQCTGLCTPWNIHLRFLMSPHPAQFVSFRFMLWLSEFHFGIVSLILSA